jgi:hypothetical protein
MAPVLAMTPAERSVLREGIVAGLIGATVVAVWFLVFDIARGRPFLTPSLLGSLVFLGLHDPAQAGSAVLPVIGYTVLHGLAFLAFGIIAASLIAVAAREPGLFVAFVILFAAFEVFFVAVLGAFGQSILGALVWWAVLVGNLLASIAMLWYLFRLDRTLPRTLVGSWAGVLREGIIAGFLGAAAVAVWFLLLDSVRGEALRTPALLGTAFLREPDRMEAVIGYTIVHGGAFIAFGILAAIMVAAAERQPMFVFALVILFTAFEVFVFGAIVITAAWVLDEVAGWAIFVGNVVAAVAMLAFFFRRHRALAHRLGEAWVEEDETG